MLQKKVCMLGSFAVGKTSLVKQFVYNRFEEKYLSTMGVKVDRKIVTVHDKQVTLLIWDLHGDDRFSRVQGSYLRGMSGFFLVVDGSRPDTISEIFRLHGLAGSVVGTIPFMVLINKCDLEGTDKWNITQEALDDLTGRGWLVRKTSAKTGENVEDCFQRLTEQISARQDSPS